MAFFPPEPISSKHPLRMLRYLEWMLLGMVTLSEVISWWFLQLPRISWLNFICLGVLVFTGLGTYTQFPSTYRKAAMAKTSTGLRSLTKRIFAPGLELTLVLLASIWGGIRLFSMLFIILVVRTCLRFDRRGRSWWVGLIFGIWIISLVLRLTLVVSSSQLIGFGEAEGLVFLSLVVLTGLAMIFLVLLANTVLAEHDARRQLAQANAQLRQYALRVEELATLQERNRIAREIHDSLGHTLTVLNLNLEAALKLTASDPMQAQAFLKDAKEMGTTLLDAVRQSVGTLRSDPLANIALETAIAQLVEEFQRSTSLVPNYQITIHKSPSLEAKTALYRITQEALTNICKYAEASQVHINLKINDAADLTICDNGKGFELNQTTSGFGLQGMRERTLALGGRLAIKTAPGDGCEISVYLPLQSES